MIDAAGGFTVDAATGEPVRDGVAVGVEPARAAAFPRPAWDDARVDRWLARQCDDRRPHRRYIGGWLDPSGRVWLDVVRVVPAATAHVALALARRAGQRCVFDLARCELIMVTGSW
jgi:hypothetical protein